MFNLELEFTYGEISDPKCMTARRNSLHHELGFLLGGCICVHHSPCVADSGFTFDAVRSVEVSALRRKRDDAYDIEFFDRLNMSEPTYERKRSMPNTLRKRLH